MSMFGNKSPMVVIFVDRNRLQFYGGGLSSILALDIPPTIVRDLEIVNRDAFYTLVNQWLKQNNLGGAELFFVLSPQSYFEKVVASTGDSEQETEILDFYESVPFEELVTKVYTINTRKVAVATNKDFVEAIRHGFMLQGLDVISMIPAVLLGTLAGKRWLDAEMGSYIIKHLESLRSQTIIDLEEPGQTASIPMRNVPTAQNNPRLMIMVGILGVLLLVLIFFIFVRR